MAVVDNRLEPLLPTTALRANRVLTGHTIVDTTGGFRNHALPTVFPSRKRGWTEECSVSTRKYEELDGNLFSFRVLRRGAYSHEGTSVDGTPSIIQKFPMCFLAFQPATFLAGECSSRGPHKRVTQRDPKV